MEMLKEIEGGGGSGGGGGFPDWGSGAQQPALDGRGNRDAPSQSHNSKLGYRSESKEVSIKDGAEEATAAAAAGDGAGRKRKRKRAGKGAGVADGSSTGGTAAAGSKRRIDGDDDAGSDDDKRVKTTVPLPVVIPTTVTRMEADAGLTSTSSEPRNGVARVDGKFRGAGGKQDKHKNRGGGAKEVGVDHRRIAALKGPQLLSAAQLTAEVERLQREKSKKAVTT